MITRLSNSQIKHIRSLAHRKIRKETGLFLVEGIRPVVEAVQLGADIETLVVAPDLLDSPFGRETVQRARQDGMPVLEISAEVFASFSRKDGPQGLAAVARQRWETLDRIVPGDELGWVVLEEAGSPGNLGTILRTCDAVGVDGVILLGETTDPYDPVSVRASMGAIFSQRIARADLGMLAMWKNRHALPLIGASGDAATGYRDMAYPRPVLLCMGGEQHGLSADLRTLCDRLVHIPMTGRADSLNLAVATGVLLYEIFYQHSKITT
ncbi:MAG: RNA methyltransferase [candidate division Zixibacteria bacterium]|nr:RNA methyltransferase [candidate division Zixibacteria bacterium]